MSEHISRKDLKHDEVRDTLAKGADAVLSHQSLAIYILIAALAVGLAVFGFKTYTERQTIKAAALYDEAMKIFSARVLAPGEPAQPGETTFTDEKTKFTQAADKFAALAKLYPRTRPGQLAEYYTGLSDERLGKTDDAKKWLQSLSDGSDYDLAAMARFELAQVHDRAGQSDEAVKIYNDLITKPSVLVPKPVVMLTLAEHYSAKNNAAEASKLYTQIKSDYPDTPIATQADQAMSQLPGKS
ncbi:MAG TPA: tetratricopeptide repeat protein [Candidatus Acidoferrales bacterium]